MSSRARTTRSTGKRTASEAAPASPEASMSSTRKSTQTQKRTKTKGPATTSTPTSNTTNETPSHPSAKNLQILESTGDIFDAPPNALLIHACNCDGSWGGGIAKAFKDRYPKAYCQYVEHCDEYGGEELFEHAQLIPPVDAFEGSQKAADDEGLPPPSSGQRNGDLESTGPQKKKHFIGCLYTSRHFGRRKDKPARVLQATAPAVLDLLLQVNAWNVDAEEGEMVGEVRMCKINSGLFGVPWEETRRVLEGLEVGRGEVEVIRVVSPRS